MGIEKLIDGLKKARADGSWNTLADLVHKAAEALSTRQAENERSCGNAPRMKDLLKGAEKNEQKAAPGNEE